MTVNRQLHFAGLQLLTLSVVALLLWWIFEYLGGLTTGPDWQFSWHPLCMVMAIVYFFTNVLVVYRVLETTQLCQDFMFRALQVVILILLVCGLISVIVWKVDTSQHHLYSLHSWLGVVTVVGFTVQFTLVISPWAKEYSTLTIWITVFVYVCALTTVETGVLQLAWYRVIQGYLEYSDYASEGILLNCMGLLILPVLLMVMWPWFRFPYSATDKYEDLDMGETADTTHLERPLKGHLI